MDMIIKFKGNAYHNEYTDRYLGLSDIIHFNFKITAHDNEITCIQGDFDNGTIYEVERKNTVDNFSIYTSGSIHTFIKRNSEYFINFDGRNVFGQGSNKIFDKINVSIKSRIIVK